MSDPTPDLLIVGGGPVGLLAGLLAHEAGLRFAVLERSPAPRPHSRAIGIHPPALALLDRLGVATPLVEAGTQIRRGHAFAGPGELLGSLDFNLLSPPWPFILTLPQWRTEEILEGEAQEGRSGGGSAGGDGDGGRAPGGSLDHPQGGGGGRGPAPPEDRLQARYVLSCEGKGSRLRDEFGMGWRGRSYGPTYVMGDFPTEGGAHPPIPGCIPPGTDAALYLHREGLVESFPLAPGIRRWVAQVGTGEGVAEGTGAGGGEPALELLVRAVWLRCGVRLDPGGCLMTSAFGVERYRADRFWKGGVILAGDAAHVVSPIGGQGMNLGWLNAADAVETVKELLNGGVQPRDGVRAFELRAGRRFRRVAARAEQNMLLANRPLLPAARNLAVRLLLHSPARRILAHRFSMGGI